MPSLPTMVYLEKEVKQVDEDIDEFEFANEYIDAYFDQSEKTKSKFTHEQLDQNLDFLLGV